ncbi:MAG: RNA polymerase sigma factor [Planctomycetaceae bacterium]|nr:RNA polymerase sigma factor [Planctomycetaceae bacterium]
MRELVGRFERPVFSLCLRMLRHRQDAEDVTQESLVRVCRHLRNWDRSRELLPWVLAIAANRCRTALEKRSRRPAPTASLPEPVSPPPPAPTGLGEEVTLVLQELREDHRTCFVLFYEQELPIIDISEIMGVPDGTIKTWLHRARKQVAERLRQRGYE